MALQAGQTLLHYRLIEPIGEGGMGVVWKAFDETLRREVAIKLLPEEVARSPERTARFEREARLLAALNHPHVATVYGFQRAGEHPFLALELVPGDGLDQMLAGGALPLAETLEMALQVAQGLEAAHEKGIVHRDLKPANIKMTETGAAKILDFGLAKAMQPEPEGTSRSPTITTGGTRAGTILGTAAYMSPEQARGRPLDRRTDIWSFGCVLFECLVGKAPFSADTVGDAIARILERQPDWSRLPESTPPAIRRLLERCLRKDHRQRLRDIGDARIVIGELLAGGGAENAAMTGEATSAAAVASRGATGGTSISTAPSGTDAAHRAPASRGPAMAVAAAALVSGALIGAAAVWNLRPESEPQASAPPLRASLSLVPETKLNMFDVSAVDISRDGRRVAYVGIDAAGVSSLYVRDLVTGLNRAIPGTETAYGPFFSPDGRWVAYFDLAGTNLMKVPAEGGAPVEICASPFSSRGGDWGVDDRIVFSPSYNQSLHVVPAGGGTPVELTRLREDEKTHRQPEILPDGKTVLFIIGTGTLDLWDDAEIATVSLDSGEIKVIARGSQPRWSSTGHVLYARAGTLYAVSYDRVSGKVGVPFEVLSGLSTDPVQGPAHYALSDDGTLVFAAGGVRSRQSAILAVDRDGTEERLDLPPHAYYRVTTSPDGTRLALQVERANTGIWIHDLSRGTLSRLTSGWESEMAVWSPDSQDIFYTVSRDGRHVTYRRPADGGGEPERVFETPVGCTLGSVSPDGDLLVYTLPVPETAADIWIAPLGDPEGNRPLLNERYSETAPDISPDGRWLAYASDQSGRFEVYVIPFPDGGRRWLVSRDGGEHPFWSRDGRELFFDSDEGMMAAAVEAGETFSTGRPTFLFETRGFLDPIVTMRSRDLHPDGRFLLFRAEDPEPPDQLELILNFPSLLEEKASGS